MIYDDCEMCWEHCDGGYMCDCLCHDYDDCGDDDDDCDDDYYDYDGYEDSGYFYDDYYG